MDKIKLNRQKEKVLIKQNFWGRIEESEYLGQFFEFEGMGFYLIRSRRAWAIVEKTTKLFVVTWLKTRKETFEQFYQFMSLHLEKVKEKIDGINSDK
ncbi:hypothetical protein H1164_08480 [Thermoactinomyces daqus]|uniref:Uncharacterized protein n=1 Tax=Thermoactinomyces daqus TaxID=1329516 RepID=A0A7W2AH73_9BACL|nr:hypothetical protein [Thermoactinomyces daqus]MBA4542937.1 hypothetical protein [Thermoactinomyces daqus]